MYRQHYQTGDIPGGAASGHMAASQGAINIQAGASGGSNIPTGSGCLNKGSVSLYLLAQTPSQVINLAGTELPASLLVDALTQAGVLSRKQLITTEELAELIRMKPQTIAKWRSAGIADPPPAIHLGRQVRYDAEEVMDWIYRNRL